MTIGRQFVCVVILLAATGVLGAQDVLITEFMARRSNTVLDDDGRRSDFIELFNAGSTAADLAGYFLSDDCGNPFKWTFSGGDVDCPARISCGLGE